MVRSFAYLFEDYCLCMSSESLQNAEINGIHLTHGYCVVFQKKKTTKSVGEGHKPM